MKIRARDGTTREVGSNYILQSGEAMVVGLQMMDSSRSSIHDGGGGPVGQRPGFLVSDDDVAHAVRETVYRQYADTISQRWQSGQDRKPAPSAPSRFATGDAAVSASYEQYRHDISNRWKSR